VLAGEVPDTTLVKLHRREAVVSYLGYPRFNRDPHPTLEWSLICDLTARRLGWRSYAERENPPVLHRKELFVDHDYPRRSLFARLTTAEERAGLFVEGERIGTLNGWESALASKQLTLRGHRLIRRPSQDGDT
jgi:DNA phosphorothioation-associated putative methyltransferase